MTNDPIKHDDCVEVAIFGGHVNAHTHEGAKGMWLFPSELRPGTEFTLPQGGDYEGERAALIRHLEDPARWEARVLMPGTSHDGRRVTISDGFLAEALKSEDLANG